MSTGGADEEPATISPKTRLKFLCSYGGRILPRPSDGHLKYVGGETRIFSVPHSISFTGLKEKISGMFNNPEIVIKYQVFPEDLDALVSVRSDEDLHHMLEEYDRHENLPRSPSSSSPLFRIYLFRSGVPTSPSTSPTYLDAINGGFVSVKDSLSIPIPSKPPMFAISSVCSSPDSSPQNGPGLLAASARSGQPRMARVRSTPNLSGGSLSQMATDGSNSATGSPKAGGGGGGGGAGFFSPHHHHPLHHHHQQQPLQQHKGGMLGYTGGGTSRISCGLHRHDTCSCGCASGCMFPGHQNQRRYHYPPSSGPLGGQLDDSHTLKGSLHGSFNFSGARTPPVVPKKNTWE